MCVVGCVTTPFTPGFHALIVPSSEAKMNSDLADFPFSFTTKSVTFGLTFPTVPVGVPRLPDGALGAGGIVTNRRTCWPAPEYSVVKPEPLSLSQNGLVGRAVSPHELIKCCSSTEGVVPCLFEARSVRTYCAKLTGANKALNTNTPTA